MKQRIFGIPAHFTLILSLMLLTFAITDQFNSAMAFINHPLTKELISALVITNLLTIVSLVLSSGSWGRILRLITGTIWCVLSVATGTILVIDYLYPARILFTLSSVKYLLIALAALSILFSLFTIVCRRKAALQRA